MLFFKSYFLYKQQYVEDEERKSARSTCAFVKNMKDLNVFEVFAGLLVLVNY